ncbi:MAG: DNA replication/repair protein RecF [Peptostreptococcaceae bacterium]|nr:DNA replication/repair protein RecF [Peptostreptococcaceae bacterium]
MIIKSIYLENFRNYEKLEVEFNEKVNILIGNNAQGKTNLIEAIYLSSMSKSFRTNTSSDLVSFNKEFAKVKVKVKDDDIDRNVEIRIDNNSKKIIKKNGKIIRKTSELFNNIIIVVFSPDDLSIVKNDPIKRRTFIDRELCQLKPKYYLALTSYNKTLKQKNALLKERKFNDNLIEVLDSQLAKYGTIISKYRKVFCLELCNISNKLQKSITDDKEELVIKYINNFKNNEITEENLYNILKENRKKDMEKGYTTVGPHRDDISFYINGIDVKKYGSQGQQRTCALTLKLAEIEIIKNETEKYPILLLDDVLSELDSERQEKLISHLDMVQLFITTTDIPKQYKDNNEIKIIKIKKGTVYN